jgi:hypothetical protein
MGSDEMVTSFTYNTAVPGPKLFRMCLNLEQRSPWLIADRR